MDRITLEVIGPALSRPSPRRWAPPSSRPRIRSNIKERWDCSTAIFDTGTARLSPRPSTSRCTSGHSSASSARSSGAIRPTASRPGDVFAANDPYTGGGTHLPDITLASPVFADGALFGFVANIAHHADRTGERIRTIYDEGLRIPPIRLVEGGRVREDVMELLLANFALPAERRGDFRAQIAANRLGERRSSTCASATGGPRSRPRRRSAWRTASGSSGRHWPRFPPGCIASPTPWTATG